MVAAVNASETRQVPRDPSAYRYDLKSQSSSRVRGICHPREKEGTKFEDKAKLNDVHVVTCSGFRKVRQRKD